MAHEGSADGLRAFLNKHKKKLKNIDAVYRRLTDNDIDEDELMNLCEVDLRETLNEIAMKKIQIGRMISVLRSCPSSVIYNETNKSTVTSDGSTNGNEKGNEVTVATTMVILSKEEQESLSHVKSKSESVSSFLKSINKCLYELQENSTKNESVINTKFDEIIYSLNKRRRVLSNECKRIRNDKYAALNKQMDNLTKYRDNLSEFHDSSQALLRDPKADPSKRRDTIVDGSNALLKTSFMQEISALAVNPKYQVIIDGTAITKIASTLGLIQDDDVHHKSFHPGQPIVLTPSGGGGSSANTASANTAANTKTVREIVREMEKGNDNEILTDAESGLPVFMDLSKYKSVVCDYVSEKGWKSAAESVDEMEFNGNVFYQCTVLFGKKGKENSYKGTSDQKKNVAIANSYAKAVEGGIPKSKAIELMKAYLPSFTPKKVIKIPKKEVLVENTKKENTKENTKESGNDLKMRFDVIEKQFESYLIRNGNGFKRDPNNESDLGINMTCASSLGTKDGSVTQFAIKLMRCDDYGAIGIASKIDCITSGSTGWIRSDPDFGNTYFIVGKGKIMSGAETSPVTSQRSGIPKLKANDVVTVKVDCQKWNVSFLVNGVLAGKQVNICKKCTYYPVICTQSKNKEYAIV